VGKGRKREGKPRGQGLRGEAVKKSGDIRVVSTAKKRAGKGEGGQR